MTAAVSQSKTDNIEFQGRKAQRADSRERRRAILEATLRIVVRDGIRGVRHRAIAKEANVPLAATTYYFKDINELVCDAFNLHAQDSIKHTEELEESGFAALEKLKGANLADPQIFDLLVNALTNAIMTHIRSQVESRDRRVIEHTFKTEALRNPVLAKTACIPQASTTGSIVSFFKLLGSKEPEADAHIVHGVILYMEYQLLLGQEMMAIEMAHKSIRRMISQLLALSVKK
ncbi:TetR/AcrR family transcriptional regulator [Simiduia agarivorans]|uniref:TetR family transcriptional regulator n=1 Tax=Simiduia agarivorans (strain DSM 21679 / JCM 13881 / BCRC 17597 / SA1) TaxID=1117647 RepID=K4KKG2_SIMAS|nr:TetR family transcriptional regulator [Simiduia agarivorans]AFU98690.1 TetR family transcriptional regulator [Simiduia agarivorans SA1 = DSM 21679]